MGLSDPVWRARYPALYPGDAYVDWIAWDPYNRGACRAHAWSSFSQTAGPFYRWLETHGHGNKPLMLAEYGSVERAGNPHGKGRRVPPQSQQRTGDGVNRPGMSGDFSPGPIGCQVYQPVSGMDLAALCLRHT